MLEVKSGKLDMLGLLFERYNRKLFNYFFRLTYRQDVSEDLVQGVFERIIKYRHTYESSDAFSTWIFRIARNLHSDYYRKNGQQRRRSELTDLDTVEGAGNTGNEINTDSQMELLKQALDKLDPLKKETLVLSRFQGFKYKEIAGIMECSESAVKVRIFRALKELKQIINELQNK